MKNSLKHLFFIATLLFSINTNGNDTQANTQTQYLVSHVGYSYIGGCMHKISIWFDSACMCGEISTESPCGNRHITFGYKGLEEEFELHSYGSFEELAQDYTLSGDLDDEELVLTGFNMLVDAQ